MPERVLFATWDGSEQDYLGSLFVPIFAGLVRLGHTVDVLQFTWAEAEQRAARGQACAAAGVGWHVVALDRLPRRARQLATLGLGDRAVIRAARACDATVLLPRAIVPAAAALRALPRLPGARLVFDADGLSADEAVEFGGWAADGLAYRYARDVEARAVRAASAVLTRTAKARDVLVARGGPTVSADKIVLAPNGKDEAKFHPGSRDARAAVRAAHGVPEGAPWVVYAGSLGPQYHPAELVALFAALRARRPDARLTVLTGMPGALRDTGFEALPAGSATVTRLPPDAVPALLAAADLGVAFRTPSWSMQGVCPIKVGEYLLCGTPVVANLGVGDLDAQLGGHPGVARLLPALGREALESAVGWLLEDVLPRREAARDEARALGRAHFGLAGCVAAWDRALRGARA